mgnify:CR=1 FL=1
MLMISVTMRSHSVSVVEFFEEDIVRNLRLLLGLREDQVRTVNVIREDAARRRKRSTETISKIQVWCHSHATNTTLLMSCFQCHTFNVMLSISRCHNHDVDATLSMPHCRCRAVDAMLSMSRCWCDAVDITLSISRSQCHAPGVTLLMSSCQHHAAHAMLWMLVGSLWCKLCQRLLNRMIHHMAMFEPQLANVSTVQQL